MNTHRKPVLWAGILLFFAFASLPGAVFAQDQAFAHAQQLAFEQRHDEAHEALQNLLASHPDYLPAQLLSAHNLAWWSHYADAVQAYDRILNEQPTLREAKLGLAYAYAWSGDTPRAAAEFRSLLESNGEDQDARKGLGYTYLFATDGAAAETIFLGLTREYPQNAEYWVALGKAYLQQQEQRPARQALDQALLLEPQQAEARQLRQNLRSEAAGWEFDLWGGYTMIDDENRFGLRAVQAFYQANARLAVFARYDNSLSLDNIDFASRRVGAGSVWAGTLIGWNNTLGSKLEVGQRFFPEGLRQNMLRFEQIFYTGSGINIKVGGFSGFSPDLPNEWFAYTSVYLPVGKLFSLEPTYYYAKDDNSPNAQHRGVLAGTFRHPEGVELTLGGFLGKSNIELENGTNTISGGYLTTLFPIHDQLWGQLAINRENGLFNTSTVFALGLKLRMDR